MKRVDIRALSEEKITPLHDAVLKNHVSVVTLLLQYGGGYVSVCVHVYVCVCAMYMLCMCYTVLKNYIRTKMRLIFDPLLYTHHLCHAGAYH